MIDFLATLDRSHGLAERFEAVPPTAPADLLWRVLVRITPPTAPAPARGQTLDPCVIGAYGHSRTDALPRGVGEAVERYALFPPRTRPPGTVRGTLRELAGRALPFDRPDLALGHPGAADRTLDWYPARRLRDGAEILVPAPLVDYPYAGADGQDFDPSPSGAAAGHGPDMALRAGLLETIERDALLVAWERRLRLARVHPGAEGPGEVLRGRANALRRNLLALWRKAERAGLEPVLADLPTGLPGVVCTVGVIVDRTGDHPLATVGCNASDDPWWSMLGALQEALQIRSVLLNAWEEHGFGTTPAPAPADIRDDDDRLRHVASRAAFAHVTEWVAGFTEERPPRAAAEAGTADLVRALVADGADPLAVDLTPRLPAGLREMGWAAVKVVPAGYQALRMAEGRSFTWNAHRLNTAEARTGRPAGTSVHADRPHPLP
ncbi:YcaO-like family protein [Streptomyces sp. NPDC007945]|uniref:YcaO-like family protein n=1 Tax=Streptomyces sp. NPDC007945 TaxID=3364797 RepID=UPI0036E3B5B7